MKGSTTTDIYYIIRFILSYKQNSNLHLVKAGAIATSSLIFSVLEHKILE